MLMGQPSPGLTRINRMNIAELTEYMVKLSTEADRLKLKMTELQARAEPPQDRVANLDEQVKRLDALRQIAQTRLADKMKRKERYDR
jgi:hypothetical protein